MIVIVNYICLVAVFHCILSNCIELYSSIKLCYLISFGLFEPLFYELHQGEFRATFNLGLIQSHYQGCIFLRSLSNTLCIMRCFHSGCYKYEQFLPLCQLCLPLFSVYYPGLLKFALMHEQISGYPKIFQSSHCAVLSSIIVGKFCLHWSAHTPISFPKTQQNCRLWLGPLSLHCGLETACRLQTGTIIGLSLLFLLLSGIGAFHCLLSSSVVVNPIPVISSQSNESQHVIQLQIL